MGQAVPLSEPPSLYGSGMSHTAAHASPRRGAEPSHDPASGETRIPLRLYVIDEPQGDADLVLSRTETEQLHATLATFLAHHSNSSHRCRRPVL